MVVDGETGVLVPPRDPAALAAAIGRVLADRAWRSRMGAAARQRAATTFSIEAHGARLQQFYDSVCASGVVGARTRRFGSRREAA